MKMKAEDKAKWLEALRSGEYKQTAGTMYDGAGYCCLGVMQKVIADKLEIAPNGHVCPQPTLKFLLDHNIEVELISEDDEEELNSQYPWLNYSGVYAQLMEKNDTLDVDENGEDIPDTHHYSFNDIADFIEKNVEVHE